MADSRLSIRSGIFWVAAALILLIGIRYFSVSDSSKVETAEALSPRFEAELGHDLTISALGTEAVRSSSSSEAPVSSVPGKVPGRSYDNNGELYLLAVKAVGANDFHVMLNGWQAATLCTSLKHSREKYEQMRSELSSDLDGSRRKLAISLILDRCSGFFNNDEIANRSLRKQLSDRLRADSQHYVVGLNNSIPSKAQFEKILDVEDWSSFAGLQDRFAVMAAKSLGISGGVDKLLVGVAWSLATCDLGRDCSQNGMSYLTQCADESRCQDSVQEDMILGLTGDQVAKVERFRALIVQAAQKRDMSFFGLQ